MSWKDLVESLYWPNKGYTDTGNGYIIDQKEAILIEEYRLNCTKMKKTFIIFQQYNNQLQ